jgi:hypothetical protein
VDYTLVDESSGEKQLEITITPPFSLIPKHTLETLGLPKKKYYGPSEVARAFGERPDVLHKKFLSGIYPEPKHHRPNGYRLLTPKEVLVLAEIKEKRRIGLF